MAEQLRGQFEKFMDWRQYTPIMLLCFLLHNSSALPPVHELLKWHSYKKYWKTVLALKLFRERLPTFIDYMDWWHTFILKKKWVKWREEEWSKQTCDEVEKM
jgi:hypothetical protein